MFLQVTFNPTHFQEPVDLFPSPLLDPMQKNFPFHLDAQQQEKKITKLFIVNLVALRIFQSEKVFPKRSKQAENI